MRLTIVALALACVASCANDGLPISPTTLDIDNDADHCVDAGDGWFDRRTGGIDGRETGVGYFQPFTNTCSHNIDLHSVSCYTRDGVRAPGNPNEWTYNLAPGSTENHYYGLGTYRNGTPAFRIHINWNACRADYGPRCERAEVLCPE